MWRLQKIMAHAGLASRRKSEEIILQGRVTVNGRVVDRLGTRADPVRDEVRIDGVLLRPERNEYYIVNKPRRVLSAVSDPRGRPVVTKLVPSRVRLVPAGRLDFQSEGLMLLTKRRGPGPDHHSSRQPGEGLPRQGGAAALAVRAPAPPGRNSFRR